MVYSYSTGKPSYNGTCYYGIPATVKRLVGLFLYTGIPPLPWQEKASGITWIIYRYVYSSYHYISNNNLRVNTYPSRYILLGVVKYLLRVGGFQIIPTCTVLLFSIIDLYTLRKWRDWSAVMILRVEGRSHNRCYCVLPFIPRDHRMEPEICTVLQKIKWVVPNLGPTTRRRAEWLWEAFCLIVIHVQRSTYPRGRKRGYYPSVPYLPAVELWWWWLSRVYLVPSSQCLFITSYLLAQHYRRVDHSPTSSLGVLFNAWLYN